MNRYLNTPWVNQNLHWYHGKNPKKNFNIIINPWRPFIRVSEFKSMAVKWLHSKSPR